MLPDYLAWGPLRRSEKAAEQVGRQDHAEGDHGHVPSLQTLLQMALLLSLLSLFHTRFGHELFPFP